MIRGREGAVVGEGIISMTNILVNYEKIGGGERMLRTKE